VRQLLRKGKRPGRDVRRKKNKGKIVIQEKGIGEGEKKNQQGGRPVFGKKCPEWVKNKEDTLGGKRQRGT